MQTYGVELITKEQYEEAMDQWGRSGGCKERLDKCQQQARREDPDWKGTSPSAVNCFKELETDCITMEKAVNSVNVS